MKKVLVVKSDILPYSETFIKEQISSLKVWRPVLVGERLVPGVALNGLTTKLIATNSSLSKLVDYLGLPYLGHVKALRSEQAKLIHVHFGTEAVKFWPVLSKLELPVVVTLHGSDINIHPEWWQKNGGLIGRKYPRRLINLASDDRVNFIAVSDAVRQRALHFGIRADRVCVKYIGVDTRTFAPGRTDISQKKRRVLYVGRLIEKKGARYLIEAFKRICSEVSDAELRIVGDGPLRDELTARAAGLAVTFVGKLSGAQVREEIQQARVLCLPSIVADNGDAEGLPIVILEAQATGVPVVTSAIGGALEGLIDNETGFATPAKDPIAMADALVRILRDDSLAQSMASAARAFILKNFDLISCTAQLEHYYDEVVSGSA